jgi:nucleoside-diphosphate-sugar epimerase
VTVLLTGATGFVGRQILAELANRGVGTRVVVRAGSASRLADAGVVEGVVHSADIFAESADWWTTHAAGIHTIVHAAWYAEPGHYVRSPRNFDCLIGTLRMAKGAAAARVRRFVGIGTCAEYDLSRPVAALAADAPLRPTSPYAAAKAATYYGLVEWLPSQNIGFAWCRLFYLFGEGEDHRRLAPYLHAQLSAGEPAALTHGDQVRDFLDVREAARMIVAVALGEEQGAVNICSGVPVTIREFAERIADGYGRRDLLRLGERPDNPFDPPRVVGLR